MSDPFSFAPAPVGDPQLERSSRAWAMFAHLSVLANFAFPFGGLLAALAIYTLRGADDAAARENQRCALNLEITLAIAEIVAIVAFVALEFSYFTEGSIARIFDRTPWQIVGCVASIALVGLAVLASTLPVLFAARTAWLGGTFRYPYAYPFLRGG